MTLFDRTQIKNFPLSSRKSKSNIETIAIDPDAPPARFQGDQEIIQKIAEAIIQVKENQRTIIIAFGAHLIKNGLGLVLKRMIDKGFVTHLATNGAGSIHDWEFAFHGRSEENVRTNVQQGKFGTWEETGKYINLALLIGAARGKGYGESIGELIHSEKVTIPDPMQLRKEIVAKLTDEKHAPENVGGLSDLWAWLQNFKESQAIQTNEFELKHPYKKFSIQQAAYKMGIPFTVHPGFGYDIIYASPFNVGAAIGRAAEVDWLRFAKSVSELEGGIYISIGSAIMSPMIFEKALSMARNVSFQNNENIKNFMIVVNDIQDVGEWKWGTGKEPPKDSPAYYLRFCKTFDRMGAREMHYLCADNRAFLTNLYSHLKKINS